MERIDRMFLLKVLDTVCKMIQERKEYLNDLDAAIGDAEHGINLARGFKVVQEKLDQMASQDIGAILKSVGSILLSEVGGASGVLYGTAFIESGKVAQGKAEVNHQDLVAMGEAALAGIKKRGRSERGDKTMIDAIEPALEAFRASGVISESMRLAAEAARIGAEDTVKMVAKKGRASYLGPRNIGHQDPGATSSALMIEAAYKTFIYMPKQSEERE
jgi:dihydroxyacetone kinase-like protein